MSWPDVAQMYGLFWWEIINNGISPLYSQDPVVENLTKLLANMTLKILSWNMANALILFAGKKMLLLTF